MKINRFLRVNNRLCGIGLFVKKGSVLSTYNYSLAFTLLWFTLGISIAYGNKR